MAKIQFSTQGAKNLHKILQKLTYKHDNGKIFSDFLTISRCALSGGTAEEEYLEIVKRYDTEEVKIFPEAFASLIESMDEEKKDILGDYYMGAVTFGEHGQYYTPEHICDLMAQITQPNGEKVCDPCCGSGRMFLSAAKINRLQTFYGTDLDFRCVQMCVLNLALNGLSGFITWGNSLEMETNRVFRTAKPFTLGKGVILEIDLEDLKPEEKQILLKTAEQQGLF